VRQKNSILIFLSHIFLSGRSGVAETMIKAATKSVSASISRRPYGPPLTE
jgi:hypothetical protein